MHRLRIRSRETFQLISSNVDLDLLAGKFLEIADAVAATIAPNNTNIDDTISDIIMLMYIL